MTEFLVPKVFDVEQAHNAKDDPRWDFFEGVDTKPQVRCQCGVWLDLEEFHINEEGIIIPGLTHQECGWSVMAQLEDWPGAEFLKGDE